MGSDIKRGGHRWRGSTTQKERKQNQREREMEYDREDYVRTADILVKISNSIEQKIQFT